MDDNKKTGNNINFITRNDVEIIELDEQGDRKVIIFPRTLTYKQVFTLLEDIGVDKYE